MLLANDHKSVNSHLLNLFTTSTTTILSSYFNFAAKVSISLNSLSIKLIAGRSARATPYLALLGELATQLKYVVQPR